MDKGFRPLHVPALYCVDAVYFNAATNTHTHTRYPVLPSSQQLDVSAEDKNLVFSFGLINNPLYKNNNHFWCVLLMQPLFSGHLEEEQVEFGQLDLFL